MRTFGFVYISGGALDNTRRRATESAPGHISQISDGTFQIAAGGGENGDGVEEGAQGRERPETVSGGSFAIDSADDAVHSNTSLSIHGGSFDVASGDDAFHADETLTVTGGVIRIRESYEGLEALRVEIQGGEISLVAENDGLNAAGENGSSGMTGGRDGRSGSGWGGRNPSSDGAIVISGGTLSIPASGDSIDANGSLEITGGTITISGPAQGDTATLDYDTTATIAGGTFFGTGASRMARSFSDSTQGVLFVNVGDQAAGTSVSISDASGSSLIAAVPELSFGVVIVEQPRRRVPATAHRRRRIRVVGSPGRVTPPRSDAGKPENQPQQRGGNLSGRIDKAKPHLVIPDAAARACAEAASRARRKCAGPSTSIRARRGIRDTRCPAPRRSIR